MTKHNKRRIAVHDGARYVGILEDIDLLSFIAGNTQLIAGRIDRAQGLDDIAAAARELDGQVRLLRRQGVKLEALAEIVSDLNRRLHAKLYGLVAPDAIRESACLIVMGSEGRGEQTLRTDQDNGSSCANRSTPTRSTSSARTSAARLKRFGFPPCPGNVMVVNPFWSKPLADYLSDFRRWISLPDEAAHMNMAIFYDAEAVAGDAAAAGRSQAAAHRDGAGRTGLPRPFRQGHRRLPQPDRLVQQPRYIGGQGRRARPEEGRDFPRGSRNASASRSKRGSWKPERQTGWSGWPQLRVAEAGLRPRSDAGLPLPHGPAARCATRTVGRTLGLAGASLGAVEHGARPAAGRLPCVKDFREIVRRHFNLGMF